MTLLERVQEISDRLYRVDFLGRMYLADYVADVGTLCTELEAVRAENEQLRASEVSA